MTEKRNTCPICKNHLEPVKAELINDLYLITLLTSASFRTAFEGSCASVENNKLEYKKLLEKLKRLTKRIKDINSKYTR